MTGSRQHLAPRRSPARSLLAACLAVFLAWVPLGQALHAVLAGHGHRYCALHDRVEDVPLASLLPAGDEGGTTALGAPERDDFDPCRVLNAQLTRKPGLVPVAGLDVRPAPAVADLEATALPLVLVSDPLASAPKHSPPALGA